LTTRLLAGKDSTDFTDEKGDFTDLLLRKIVSEDFFPQTEKSVESFFLRVIRG
jgi:hypothetical protein